MSRPFRRLILRVCETVGQSQSQVECWAVSDLLEWDAEFKIRAREDEQAQNDAKAVAKLNAIRKDW